ncbi:MAG: hypothetical protein IPL32_11180 [Chloracidobacterium sp.]|nr:hypothetical protein [Chloracidobacterium sp.]
MESVILRQFGNDQFQAATPASLTFWNPPTLISSTDLTVFAASAKSSSSTDLKVSAESVSLTSSEISAVF